MSDSKFAVLGAGAGGQAMAAILAHRGCYVTLYDINSVRIEELQRLKTLESSGKITCTGTPNLITTDIAAAVKDVDAIMVCTTTDGHRDVACRLVPLLRDGQIILLNPGHVGGAMEVTNILRNEYKCKAKLIIAEAADLMYACRLPENGHPYHSGVKNVTEVAALPASDTAELLDRLLPCFPNLKAAHSVLETGFEGGGAMLHPVPTLMNLVRTEAGQPYDYYMEGITPGVAKLVSRCDAERVAVCRALGLNARSLVHTLQEIYGLTQEDLHELLQNNKAYVGVKSPMSLDHRFLVEDTLCGLVPLASIGRQLGVETPIMDAYIDIASIVTGRDFRADGRTAEHLGLTGKTAAEIRASVQ